MRHRNSNRKLNRTSSHQAIMLQHGQLFVDP